MQCSNCEPDYVNHTEEEFEIGWEFYVMRQLQGKRIPVNTGRRSPQAGITFKGKCWKCEEFGHRASECPKGGGKGGNMNGKGGNMYGKGGNGNGKGGNWNGKGGNWNGKGGNW